MGLKTKLFYVYEIVAVPSTNENGTGLLVSGLYVVDYVCLSGTVSHANAGFVHHQRG